MKKKIFIITSSRADYSPLKNLIHAFEESKLFKTFIIATGQHLDKKSGNTINEIKKNHKAKIRKVKIQYKKFSENDISFYMSQMIKKFSLLLKKNRPHLIMILGDRYEVLSFALAAVQFRIPIAHIHGGEVTKGSLDNSLYCPCCSGERVCPLSIKVCKFLNILLLCSAIGGLLCSLNSI